jgi:ATP-dependent Clp protease ATP-binding subunit ClpB
MMNSKMAEHPLRARLRHLDAHLHEQIRGQYHVVGRVASVLRRGELGLAHPGRPKGSFLFVGPTGVGKTEITNAFTAFLFEGVKPLRFDMSEYQNQLSVEKLLGEKVGDIGLLGKALAKAEARAGGTLLFDEVEKAHPLMLDLFLQILDDASITPTSGERKKPFGILYCLHLEHRRGGSHAHAVGVLRQHRAHGGGAGRTATAAGIGRAHDGKNRVRPAPL